VAAAFVQGLDLAREFYAAVVGPLLRQEFPGLPYAAALLGPGSEVAGFAAVRSTDHDWGPRRQVLLSADDAVRPAGDAVRPAGRVDAVLAGRLPESFRGYPVRFPVTREPEGPSRPRVEVAGLGGWLTGLLGSTGARVSTSSTGWPLRPSGWPSSPGARSSTTRPGS
jgi:hypothetical protein